MKTVTQNGADVGGVRVTSSDKVATVTDVERELQQRIADEKRKIELAALRDWRAELTAKIDDLTAQLKDAKGRLEWVDAKLGVVPKARRTKSANGQGRRRVYVPNLRSHLLTVLKQSGRAMTLDDVMLALCDRVDDLPSSWPVRKCLGELTADGNVRAGKTTGAGQPKNTWRLALLP